MAIFSSIENDSFLLGIDPRIRVLTTLIFALCVVLMNSFLLLTIALVLSLSSIFFADLLNLKMAKRMTEINILFLFLLVMMPLSVPGDQLFSLGTLHYSETGFFMALKIGLKSNAIMILSGVMVATIEPATLGLVLTKIGVPAKLAHIFLFMVRYIESVAQEYRRLRNAMVLRGFKARANMHSLRSIGYLVGMMLVRTMDRADRISDAMKCRGFHGKFYILEEFKARRSDLYFFVFALLIMITLVCADLWFCTSECSYIHNLRIHV